MPSPNSQLVMDNFSFLLPSAAPNGRIQGQINVLSGGELRLGGNLTNASLAGITNSGGTIYIEGTLTEAGQSLNVGSGTALGAVVIDHTGKLIGAGTISGPINDNGTIEANGTVAVTGPVTGNGQLVIDANSNLVVGGAVAQAVAFNGTNATLTLNNPAGFTGTISGLAPDDMIDLVNTIVTSATIEGFVLELTESDGSSLFYQINGALTGNSFSVQSDLNGGTLLVLNTTVPYGSLFDASGLLTTDINDGVSADQITSDALRIYTTGVAGAIGTLGGAEWQRAYETSNTNATNVGVDIANAAGTSQIQSAAVNLFGTIIAGAVGSVADGAQHAAYQNILQAANTLGTDIGNGAGINQLKSNVESLYATIAGAAISSPAWQQAVSASDQAATTLGNNLAANAASSQILGDIANLYDTIVAGALGAIGGTTLQQAYTAGPSVITLGTDVANSASATQVQIDLAGLYKSVIAGVRFKRDCNSATAVSVFNCCRGRARRRSERRRPVPVRSGNDTESMPRPRCRASSKPVSVTRRCSSTIISRPPTKH